MATRSGNRIRLRGRSPDVHESTVIDLRDGATPTRRRRPAGRTNSTGPKRIDPSDLERPAQLRESKYFGSPAFMRLWFSQALSSLGDWIGIIAITAIANRVGGKYFAGGAVSLVIAVRIMPTVFLSPIAGVLVDRWNRKAIMVICDLGRGLVLCFLPFVDNLLGLILVSLILEIFTLMWSPAKEASVPNLVNRSFLPTANSMSLAAAYGTFVPATLLFAILAKVPDWLGQSDHLTSLNLTQESVALYFDALTYLLSAAVIATLAIPQANRYATKKAAPSSAGDGEIPARTGPFQQAKDGWKFMRRQPRIRAVTLGMCIGLIGGASVVPLGPLFATDVLGAGSSGYGLLLTAMGSGVAAGVLMLTVLQKRLPHDRMFVAAAFGCGIMLVAAAAMDSLGAAVALIFCFGLCAGALYVLGLTMLQTNATDQMRGRVFTTFYTLTRACIFFALVSAPIFSVALNTLSNHFIDGRIDLLGASFALPGVRLTLWASGLIILGAGVVAVRTLRRPLPVDMTATQ